MPFKASAKTKNRVISQLKENAIEWIRTKNRKVYCKVLFTENTINYFISLLTIGIIYSITVAYYRKEILYE